MKNSVYPIDLVDLTTEKDSLNQVVEKTRTTNTVFAEVSSVSQTEFFSGGRIGLQPSLKVVIYDFEYNDEPIVKWNGKLYSEPKKRWTQQTTEGGKYCARTKR